MEEIFKIKMYLFACATTMLTFPFVKIVKISDRSVMLVFNFIIIEINIT